MRATGLLRLLSVPLALVRLARVLLRARPAEPPQCVLVLGGCKERELEAARMFGAAAVPSAHMLLLSSGAASLSELQAAAAPAAAHTVLVDRRAVDTVTNFTTVARSLAAAGVTSVACATAREHCRRALAVGTLVLGAEGECLCGSNAAAPALICHARPTSRLRCRHRPGGECAARRVARGAGRGLAPHAERRGARAPLAPLRPAWRLAQPDLPPEARRGCARARRVVGLGRGGQEARGPRGRTVPCRAGGVTLFFIQHTYSCRVSGLAWCAHAAERRARHTLSHTVRESTQTTLYRQSHRERRTLHTGHKSQSRHASRDTHRIYAHCFQYSTLRRCLNRKCKHARE